MRKEQKHAFKSGATSTRKVRFGLIHKAGLIRIANACQRGIDSHGDKALNNLAKNQSPLTDIEFLITRAEHAIDHAYNMIDKLSGRVPLTSGEDDAGAIGWAGMILGAATDELLKELGNDGKVAQKISTGSSTLRKLVKRSDKASRMRDSRSKEKPASWGLQRLSTWNKRRSPSKRQTA